jgi:hypothetical protein
MSPTLARTRPPRPLHQLRHQLPLPSPRNLLHLHLLLRSRLLLLQHLHLRLSLSPPRPPLPQPPLRTRWRNREPSSGAYEESRSVTSQGRSFTGDSRQKMGQKTTENILNTAGEGRGCWAWFSALSLSTNTIPHCCIFRQVYRAVGELDFESNKFHDDCWTAALVCGESKRIMVIVLLKAPN